MRLLPSAALVIVAFVSALGLSSCDTMTATERRIHRHPEMYAKLKTSHRELVQSGSVTEGMSRDAVYLAWGRPDMVKSGSRQGKGSETWAYMESVPVQTNSFSYGGYHPHSFYHSYGVHPRYGYSHGPGWSYGTHIDFAERVSRTVEFSNNRVVAWERTR